MTKTKKNIDDIIETHTPKLKRETFKNHYYWTLRLNGKIVSRKRYTKSDKKTVLLNKIDKKHLSLNKDVYKQKLVKVIETFDTSKRAKIDTKHGSNYQYSIDLGVIMGEDGRFKRDIVVARSMRFYSRSELKKSKNQAKENFWNIITAREMGDQYKSTDDPRFKRLKKELKRNVRYKKIYNGTVSYHDV